MQQRIDWKDVGQIETLGGDGTTYQLTAKRQFERHQFQDGSWSDEKPIGVEAFELADGTEVFRMGDGTFQVNGSGVVLTPKEHE